MWLWRAHSEAWGGIKEQANTFVYKDGTLPRLGPVRMAITCCGKAKQIRPQLGNQDGLVQEAAVLDKLGTAGLLRHKAFYLY